MINALFEKHREDEGVRVGGNGWDRAFLSLDASERHVVSVKQTTGQFHIVEGELGPDLFVIHCMC